MNMSGRYFAMGTHELKTLRSKKFLLIQKYERERMTYFRTREIETLRQQLKWIDGVLNSRAEQLSFL